jgi:hypothetical protein
MSHRALSLLFYRTYCLRGFRCWVITRAIVSAILSLGGNDALRLPWLWVALVIGISGGYGVLTVVERGEQILVANLGVSSGRLFAVLAAPAIVAEAIILFA